MNSTALRKGDSPLARDAYYGQMSSEITPDLELEIGHVLVVDIVGYSIFSINEQGDLVRELNQIVRGTDEFRHAESAGKLVRLPTGDGMVLVFYNTFEAPARCALEIARAVKKTPQLRLRMGVHSGPVRGVVDVNDRSNLAGAGINIAQRMMNCADADHILLTKRVAEDLAQYRHWQPLLHELGECEVKHGVKVSVVNLFTDELGNPQPPQKFKALRAVETTAADHARKSQRKDLTLAILILLTAGLLGSGLWFYFTRTDSKPIVDSSLAPENVISEKSIAVLPFANLSDDKQNAYFTDGVQDEILNNLAKVADLKVISRTSVFQYKPEVHRNLREIAKALGVAHILEGTVQRLGDRVRVSAQLIDARTDAHMWGDHYDRQLADVFAIESEVAQRIVAQLKARLSSKEKAAIQERPTSDVAAYDLYIQAKALMASSVYILAEPNLLEAARLLEEAVVRDPMFFLGFCRLASVHDQIYLGGIDHTKARLAKAEAAVNAALHLRPNAGEAHLALVEHLYCGYLDYDRAREELAIARAALPNESRVFELAAYIDRRQGRCNESTVNFQHALDLDPRNFYILQQIARSYHYLRRYTDELAMLDRALAIMPQDVGVRVQRAVIALEWHADTKPLHAFVENLLREDPAAANGLFDQWLYLALCERDPVAGNRVLAVIPEDGFTNEGFSFPKAWCEARLAQMRGDAVGARNALTIARTQVEKMVTRTT